ncbi:MAG: DNA mismatch repair endonuclease MutL [Syntrophaceae bacterium]|nr:DNA mismatch repair endonuclease MutL [Syntrophaceae bacterium]
MAQVIAAGEVIERPASVVKELVENAIDAGSSEIVVELERAGLQLIRVYDDGEGIDREDLPIAFQRYATSKVRKAEDLYAIHTLGFRGEALPSIASVSKMTIKTRVQGSITGTKAVCEGGEIKSISEVGCPIGTEVEVRQIFYNIPVKRRFLKSIRSELRYSLNYFLRLSLSHPFISFKLIHDHRMLYQYPKTESPLVRVEAVLGRDLVDHLRPYEIHLEDIGLSGFASLPTISKGNADGIYLYVNRRFVRDRMIHRAVMESYRHLIPTGRFPIVILFLSVPPSTVDVNVHPTKAEVKFRDPERVFLAVTEALCSLHGRRVSVTLEASGRAERGLDSENEASVPAVLATYLDQPQEKKEPVAGVSEPMPEEWKAESKLPFRILGQLQRTYILCEGEEGLIIIDQHAAHERVLFNRYRDQHETRSIVAERFLLPIPMELSAEESFILETHLGELQSMGFEIDPIGGRTYAIRSRPSFVDEKDAKGVVREILDALPALKGEGRGAGVFDTILITLACHSAIRANCTLRREEMEELLRTLWPIDLHATCPHGRPIFFQLHLDDLNRQFKRRS